MVKFSPSLTIPAAFSPCPNDTFLFHAWAKGMLPTVPSIEPVLADIEQLNEWMLKKQYPLTKASAACIPNVIDDYVILPAGAALGYKCGPKIVSKKPFNLSELSSKSIAIPGIHTTAHALLFKLCPSPGRKVFQSYETILDSIAKEEVDCGLIIHESRFIFKEFGLHEVADLGELWHEKTNLPIPLGVLAAKRSLGEELLSQLTHSIRQSISYAKSHPKSSEEFILELSQEKDPNIIRQHIDLYVNESSERLDEKGIEALETLTGIPRKKLLFQSS